MAFGVTPEGFSRPTVQEIKEALEREQLASIDPTLDIATDPVVGQNNAIFAQHLGKGWEALEAAYHAFDPDRAEDDRLIALAKLTGTDLRGATYSEVNCQCNFANDGVPLESGVHFANVIDRPDIRFTPKQDFTSPSGGIHIVRFRAEQTGPVQASAGDLSVIATPVTGWNSVNNPDDDATPGQNIETNEELRLRREVEIARRGAATVKAIRADVSAVDGVAQVKVFENRMPSTSALGLPPHSFEVVVFDNDGGALDDAVAQAIWDSKPGGIRDFATGTGATTGEAIDDLGDVQSVHFSRAEELAIYLVFEIEVNDDYVGDSAFKSAIAFYANSVHDIDDTVIASFIRSLPFQKNIELANGTVIPTLGVEDVVSFAIGLGPFPTGDVNIPVNQRQIARFDTSRITVTQV